MANCKKCTLILDTGADISLFKVNKVDPQQFVNTSNKIKLTGITDTSLETLATTCTKINFSNGLMLNHEFHLVPKDIPIHADGILGRDFLTNHKCIIDYEHWLLIFNIGQAQIAVPIEDNLNQGFMLPNRSEVIRKISNIRITEDMVVHSQEISPGIFCGNTIISPDKPFVKFINTTNYPVYIPNFKPKLEPLRSYTIMKYSNNTQETSLKIQEILKEIDISKIPNKSQNEFVKLLSNYADIFCLPTEKLTTNNFYSQNIVLNDNIPTYIPNYKTIHSQYDEIQSQVNRMPQGNPE